MFEEPQKLRKNGELVDAGTHCFLGVVKQDPGQKPEIVEELHFRRPRRGNTSVVQAIVYKQSRHDFDDPALKRVCHQTGDEETIFGKWDKALKLAKMVQSNPPAFENNCAYSFNCRAFAIGSLNAMGFRYVPAAENDVKGRLARVWETYSPALETEPDHDHTAYLEELSA